MVFPLCGLPELDGKIFRSCILFCSFLMNGTIILKAQIEFLIIILHWNKIIIYQVKTFNGFKI